ncbi:DUF2218 domain-containing protein [Actibacterium ureilyticum]|uniref:DUF2218 domain-containing protein n=1 Tax=Actibacterium ureilyticum TaxID=1590614 RepID=UPI000BAAD831|nr:DUF2218 domain-containing protein [Actibacterium ureilyticum]
MPVSQGRFETPNASKYLQQLCKHFAHKIEVEYDASKGVCQFPMGVAVIEADDTALTVRLDIDDPERVPAGQSVIDKHLERFAFREDFTTMTWDG